MPKLESAPKIWPKLDELEKEIQRLKWQVVLSLPSSRAKSLYSEAQILPAVREIRKQLFKERYGSKA